MDNSTITTISIRNFKGIEDLQLNTLTGFVFFLISHSNNDKVFRDERRKRYEQFVSMVF